MFPIICLYSQLEQVNDVIKRHKLSKDSVLRWLGMYGEVDATPLGQHIMVAFRSNVGLRDVAKIRVDSAVLLIPKFGRSRR